MVSFLLLLLCFALAVFVHGQIQTGFISIDCGARENFNFVDIDTGISYTSDGSFINTGINKNISAEYAYPNNPTLPQPLSDLRSFPQGNKNCYTLTPTGGRGSLNLIRASFLYGNYDGENKLPEFDLYLDVNLWFSVKFKNASDIVTTEIISVAPSDTIYICLVNTGLGTPFISALELRPLNGSIYNNESGTSGSLILFERWDIGYLNGSGRYQDDIYDRIWSPYSSSSWNSISTSSGVDISGNGYKAPLEVMKTAARPGNGSESLELYWTTTDPESQFYIYMYFAELEQLGRNQSREFNVSWNGTPLFGPFIPRYLFAATISNSRALVGKEHRISVYKIGNSTFPPILNAVEIFMLKQSNESLTYSEDDDAINNIRTTYQVNRNWVGDPCGPKNYSWEGLKCSYNDSNPPQIISLNLTSSSLIGRIADSIANLSSLETLDLSNNNLSGTVPEFLEELPFLKFLNLKGNQLSGFVPAALLDKSEAELLTLIVDDQNLCTSNSCKKNKKVIVPIIASVSSALVLLIVLMIIWRIRRKRISERAVSNEEGKTLASKNRQFTYAEVVSITNNFQTTLGKGGFGTVYLGNMKDGTQVAVKMLSSSSSQGSKEFQTEAELLMRVHHRNLASFVGYCDDNNNLALIYEYMTNGNLKDYLSDRTAHNLSWETRLQIAIDAAQGLEYLHHGCKPPIIHRDVKTANILLSESLDAKIADFGLSKVIPSDGQSHVSTTVMGTRGYLDPQYYISQRLNEKSDVYSFGIVLLELITSQPAIIKSDDHIHILEWVNPLLERGEIEGIVDQRLQGDYDVNSAWKALEVAMACTAPTSIQRATMSFVLTELKECLAMEVARERATRPKEDIYIKSYTSTEVFSSDFDSMSMTGPSVR
uniref:non-specific serine/threonine protein kinase n=1 Tax=Davidia involucrata TaxID=16924 RepID=A0A5B7BWG1_DAVIN